MNTEAVAESQMLSPFAEEICSRCEAIGAAVFAIDAAGQTIDPINARALGTPTPDVRLIEASMRCFETVRLESYNTHVFVPASTTSAAMVIVADSPARADLIVHVCRDMERLRDSEQTVRQFGDRLSDSYEQVHLLFRLARLLNSAESPAVTMQAAVAQIRGVTRFGWMIAKFADGESLANGFRNAHFSDGDLPMPADAIARQLETRFAEGSPDNWLQILSPQTDPLAASTGQEAIIEPITMDGSVIAALAAGSKVSTDPDIDSFDTQLLDAVADFIGVFHQNVARFQQQHELFLGTIHALASAIDAKDHYTRGHSDRVSTMAAAMAQKLGLDPRTVEQYRIAGLVHDVGKIGVPEAVLRKPGKLDDSEFTQLKAHPRIGYEMLQHIRPLAGVLPGVLHHHERWDGRGYPDRLAGDQIPLMARVLALADTYDAMTSNRSYRTALKLDFVVSEIRKCAGTQFDPALVEQFIAIVS